MGAKITTLEEAKADIVFKIEQLMGAKKEKREGLSLKDIFLHLEESLASHLDIFISFDDREEFKDDYYFDVVKNLLLGIIEEHIYQVYQGPAFQKAEGMVTDASGQATKKQGVKENYAGAISGAMSKVILPDFFEAIEILRSRCNIILFDDAPIVNKGVRGFMDLLLKGEKNSSAVMTAAIFPLLAATEVLINNLNSGTTEDDFYRDMCFYRNSCARVIYAVLDDSLAVLDDSLEYTPPTPENKKNNIYKLAACLMLADVFMFNVIELPDTPRELAAILNSLTSQTSDKVFDGKIPKIPKVDVTTYGESLLVALCGAMGCIKRVRLLFGKEKTDN